APDRLGPECDRREEARAAIQRQTTLAGCGPSAPTFRRPVSKPPQVVEYGITVTAVFQQPPTSLDQECAGARAEGPAHDGRRRDPASLPAGRCRGSAPGPGGTSSTSSARAGPTSPR